MFHSPQLIPWRRTQLSVWNVGTKSPSKDYPHMVVTENLTSYHCRHEYLQAKENFPSSLLGRGSAYNSQCRHSIPFNHLGFQWDSWVLNNTPVLLFFDWIYQFFSISLEWWPKKHSYSQFLIETLPVRGSNQNLLEPPISKTHRLTGMKKCVMAWEKNKQTRCPRNR